MSKDEKKEVRGQGALAKVIKASIPDDNDYVEHHGNRCGSTFTIVRNGKLLTRTWDTYARGAVDEDWIKEMIEFINQP